MDTRVLDLTVCDRIGVRECIGGALLRHERRSCLVTNMATTGTMFIGGPPVSQYAGTPLQPVSRHRRFRRDGGVSSPHGSSVMAMSNEQLQSLYQMCHDVTITLEQAGALLMCIEVAATHPDSDLSLDVVSSAVQGVASVLHPIKRNGELISGMIAARQAA